MKVERRVSKKSRIEMIPMIDMMFLLLVAFTYGMLSMAVHRGLPVLLPASSTTKIDKSLTLSVTVKADGTIYLDKSPLALEDLSGAIQAKVENDKEAGVLLFADRNLPYQQLVRVLDQIRSSGLHRVSLQAEEDKS